MVRYREIARLTAKGLSQRAVAASVGCARSTVSEVRRRGRRVAPARRDGRRRDPGAHLSAPQGRPRAHADRPRARRAGAGAARRDDDC